MSVMEDLISFDIIETQKENIQSLPQGRSAKALAAQFGPTPFSPAPTPGATRSLNDAIRQEYETELQGIVDADDPLDIYDRYVKWTMNAYPSAQATPESQLRQLLERTTKAFQGSAQYKNDVRYLKLWLSYIRFFSDAPRETYAYLSRHAIGEGLALFYEEFAAWLESAGRWTQAEEIYKLGIEKEARPIERLMRKFGEFQKRFEARPHDAEEPTSPALPTVRPALAAKLDPFASSTSSDPQSRRGVSSSGSSKGGRTKMAIFSDTGDSSSGSRPGTGDTSKGWDNIGTISERKKENTVEARPWVGETLKAGRKTSGPKMMVFKDQPSNASRSVYINSKNGKTEKWFADILSVCPNEDVKDEYCFEELRARHRGWLTQTWTRHPVRSQNLDVSSEYGPNKGRVSSGDTVDSISETTQSLSLGDDVSADVTLGLKKSKSKKKRVMEVKSETQTIKAVLDSPAAKPKLKRKKSSEPTMTLHTKAATDDVLDLFNQPLRNVDAIGSRADSDGDTTDYDPEDYTCGVSSAGDNTRTGNLSETESVYNDDITDYQSEIGSSEATQAESASPWSEFSTAKHVPKVDDEQNGSSPANQSKGGDLEHSSQLHTPVDTYFQDDAVGKYVPVEPEGIEAPKLPFRTAEQMAQSRLPFMTPIVERTESSMGLSTIRHEKEALYPKTPSRRRGDVTETIPELDSPFQEIVDQEAHFVEDQNIQRSRSSPTKENNLLGFGKPIIQDKQLNPHEDSVRESIMSCAQLTSADSYHDHRHSDFGRGVEIRKFIKSLQKISRPSTDKVVHSPPVLIFPGDASHGYTVRRELGKGSYAPVYLASVAPVEESENVSSLVAMKSENPPSPWEFYILSALYNRLALVSPRHLSSFTKPLAFHHFSDEVYLLESYHDQGTLLDLVNLVRSEPSLNASGTAGSGSSGLDECVAMFFAIELLRAMDAMHQTGILHGDLKADNCLVRLGGSHSDTWSARYEPSGSDGWSEKGIALIDLGRGIDMTAFRQDVGFLADWKTSKDDCVEMRELRPWTHQVDYWGAAGVLHVLLFGKWIEDAVASRDRNSTESRDEATDAEKTMVVGKAGQQKRMLKENLKRYWQIELWSDVFDLLMNPTSWVEAKDEGRLPVKNRLKEVTMALEQWLAENSERKGLRMQLKKLGDRIKEKRRKD